MIMNNTESSPLCFSGKLSTRQQRKEASVVLMSMPESGERALPEELYHVIRSRFEYTVFYKCM